MAVVARLALGALIAAGICIPAVRGLTARGQPRAAPAGGGIDADRDTNLRFRGMAMQLHHVPRGPGWRERLVREIAELGADSVLLCCAMRMEHARSQALFVDARETPPADDLAEVIRAARRLGLRVVVMPMVLLRHPRGSEWRGVIDPPSWAEWWREYGELVDYFAQAAGDGGADAFVVGSELISTEKSTAEWVRLIERVRARLPGVPLGYSANWDHYRPIQFWDKLDFVGMTTYYTLAKQKSPSVAQIVRGWEPIRAEITEWARRVGKPLVLTEVGWCSQEGAASAPWNYYQNQRATPEGHEEQRRLYQAFMQAWDATPELSGVFWWEWSAAPGGEGDTSYTPRAKPAESLLCEWFARERGAATREGSSSSASQPVDVQP